ncbi:MAG: bifunctional UDP-N-acetylmuramoyl-tripeptide:D-alanyl-D-alanine ligase/alanine racemase [Bacteroidota bacterium]|nr:bifunctional UDP-N-acetylmuramoyl-tripeptide:D-alanyl-D-alanine ligase/alanine racemase [Bacteroidota bacterium]
MNPGSYTITDISGILKGTFINNSTGVAPIQHLLTDSRKIVSAPSSLFFAIKGDRRDGHEFIEDLYQAGVRNFVISDPAVTTQYPDCNFIITGDTLQALQQLAAQHRSQFKFPVVGITGSNGKTIVKEWLYQLLREDHHIVRSPKSYNSQIGVPLSVWQMKPENDMAIFEAGISEPGEMKKLETIIQPDTGIFTNIGSAHDENFGSLPEKVNEKMLLFKNCSTLIYCKDYLLIADQITKADFLSPSLKLFTWSRKQRADLQIGRVSKMGSESEIQGIYKNSFLSIHIPFTDDASIENAIQCWAALLFMNYDPEVIAQRIQLLSPVAMRLEMKEGINNCSIINDSYNSDLGSLTIALDFLNQQKQHAKRTVVLSDILQSGRDEAQLYKEVADLLHKKGVSRLIGIGPAISRQAMHFDTGKTFFESTDDFLKEYTPSQFNSETILLKGARTFGFERISKVLQQKAHETVLEINLNALIHNLNYYRSRLKPETKIMVMVKAFSYGSGSFEISNILQFHRVDYLAVAYADEGVELRKAGITLPVMVMNPEEQSFEIMLNYKLEPEIYNFRMLQQFSDVVKRRLSELPGVKVPVHIKLDTGMHRLGFEMQDINELVVRIKNNKHLKVASVFSHLAASDEAVHDGFTNQQANLFMEMADIICGHFPHKIFRHILNSAGIMRFPEFQLEMVRLGIGLHGIAATQHEQKQLQFVATLKTTISQIKTVKAHQTIGYSRKGVVSRDTLVATVAIGYADGLNRKLGNGAGSMLVNQKKCPIIGGVCMDMTMLDITDAAANEGDEVIVFGPGYSIIEMARDLGTIPYEILTMVSQRVKRVYFHE